VIAAAVRSPKAADLCRYCWMCRHVCPVGHVTHRETLTPHGWALIMASVERGLLSWNADTVGALYACADCGLCRTHCVTDQPLPDAIVAARAALVAKGLAPQAVYDLEGALEHALEKDALEGDAERVREDAGGHADGPIGLYVNDVIAVRGPQSVEAARRLLSAAGIETVPVAPGRSSGLLASALGLAETAARLGRGVLQAIDTAGCRELMVLSPGDRFTFEHVYPNRLGLPWPASVAVKEVTIALADAMDAGRLRFHTSSETTAWSYHDPCHGPRIGRDAARPRALLTAFLGPSSARDLFWRAERAHPCGAIGGLELTHPDIAAELARARIADARSAGATCIVSDDAECVAHLKQAASSGTTVVNLYELLESRMVHACPTPS
jgi:Fe-S oxidoreductase